MKFIKKHPNLALYLIISLPVLIYFSFFLNKGLTLYDEGYIAESSYLTSLGKIPYKDFYFQYTPLTAWVGAIIFKIFGVGILQLRWFALTASIVTILFGYGVAKELTNRVMAAVMALAFVAWGFPQANFLWPSSLSLLFFFITLFCFIKFDKTKNFLYLSAAGAAVAGNILTKQNLGTILLVTSIIFIPLIARKFLLKSFIQFFIPLFLILVAGSSVTFLNNPNFSGIREFISRSLMVARGQILYSPYPLFDRFPNNPSNFVRWAVKTYLYLSPVLLILVLGLKLFIKRDMKPLIVGIFISSAFYFFTAVWPTADLAHFTFGVPALLLVFMVANLVYKGLARKIALFSVLLFALIGFYKVFFMSYYTFETPYLRLRNTISIRGEKLIVDKKYKVIVDYLNENKEKIFANKSIFVYSYAPMIYFILDKNPPIYDLYTVENLLSPSAVSGNVDKLEKTKTDFVLLETWRESNSEISRFIRKNYRKVGEVWDFEILERI